MFIADAWTSLFAIIFGVELLAVYGVTSSAKAKTDEADDFYE
jgi:hypothetical protein